MKSTFEIIDTGFARHVVNADRLTGQPVRNSAIALTMNHPLLPRDGSNKTSSSRLTGWAIIRSSGATVQARLSASGIDAGDPRTRFVAFEQELANLTEPVVLLTFSKSTVNIGNVYATYDTRVVRVCSPDGVETFDFTTDPGPDACIAHRNMAKARARRLNAAAKKEKADAA